jgi:hypothetical protein
MGEVDCPSLLFVLLLSHSYVWCQVPIWDPRPIFVILSFFVFFRQLGFVDVNKHVSCQHMNATVGNSNKGCVFHVVLLALQVGGVSKIETIKYAHESCRTGLVISVKNWKLQTRLLVREGTPHQQTRNCLKVITEKGEKLVAGPRWVPDTRTDWPTDCRS